MTAVVHGFGRVRDRAGQGEVVSFNEWGCKATGWTEIQIKKRAVLPDGRLFEELREVSE